MPGTGAKGRSRTARSTISSAEHSFLLEGFPGILLFTRDLEDAPLHIYGLVVQITGYEPDEFQSGAINWYAIIHPEDRLRVREDFALREPDSPDKRSIDFRIVRRDGAIRWLRCSQRRVPMHNGGEMLISVTLYDITDLVQAEASCLIRETRISDIIRNAPAGMGMLSGRVMTDVNDRFCEMTGYTREQLVGRDTRFLYESDQDYERIGQERDRLRDSIGPSMVESRVVRSDGTVIDLMINSAPVDPSNPSNGTAFIAVDVTGRKQAEDSLEQSERLLSSVFSSVQDGISVLDRDLRILRVNEAMERWYPHAMPLEGKICHEAYHGRREPCAVCPSIRALEQGSFQEDVVPLTAADGSVAGWLDLFSFPLIDRVTGEVTGVIEYVRNISQRVAAEVALRKEKELLEGIAEVSPAGILVIDRGNRIVFANAMAETIFAMPRKALSTGSYTLQGWNAWTLDGIPMKKTDLPLEITRATGKAARNEGFQLELPNGHTAFVSVSTAPLSDLEGALDGIVVTIEDVSERVRAQESLRRSEQFFRAAIDSSPIGISVRSSTGRLLQFNKSWKEIWAIPDEDIEADLRSERKTLKLDDRDGYLGVWVDHVKRVYEVGGTLNIPELKTRSRRAGAAEWVSQHFYALPDNSGKVDRVVIMTEDISERKKAELALRESEERYRALAEAAQDLIFVVDRDDSIQYVNSISAKFFGGSQVDIVGRKRSELFPPGAADTQKKSLDEVFSTGAPIYRENVTGFPGSPLWLGTWLAPLRDSSGNVTGVLEVSRNITARKQAEEKERLLQEQLGNAQRLESIGRLAGGVAHDFNNLLTVILGHLELILADLPQFDTPLRSGLIEIQKAGGRARNLTGQLLAFGRKQLLTMAPVNLNDLISGFSGILRRLIGEDVEIVTRLFPETGLVSADTSQIEQVLMNLAVNARDAMPLGGVLRIETSPVTLGTDDQMESPDIRPGRHVLMQVSDTGTGMDATTRSRIFDPFFTTKEVGKGTGLGLATVYGIVKQHDGHITVSSEPGKGTTFRIFFPEWSGKACEQADSQEMQPISRKKATILVVEDDFPVRQLITRILEEAGYTVIECAEPLQAAGMAQQHGSVDLLVTDVVMPGLSGQKVHEEVSGAFPGIRVLYISGYTDDVVASRGLAGDSYLFLQKPFTVQGLLLKVALALE